MSDRTPDVGPEGRSTEDPTISIHSLATAGGTIGPYLLRELIGSGGMGEVWKAEQTTPIRRIVALKLIKPGMDSREVLARFEAERQALALMDHPCIAKVFDAGTTHEGHPYFAMEYVQGVPITEYCDRRKLSTKDRLELFQRVCAGVQHAHQKAILHRDLKPSNILVSDVDGRPVPRIIDFGVAKATTQKLSEKTMYTALGQLIGTPEYMSPEQADLTAEDVDTRSDVYSLGVILYELLVGTLPFMPEDLRKAGFEGIVRMLREQDPPRPSIRLSMLGERATHVARNRVTEPRRLASELRGDLDSIAMQCLEKDRNRRYGSVQELAQDIRKHLSDEPVVARPPSAVYRTKKFVRRHQYGVTTALLGAIALLVFAGMMAWQEHRTAQERDRANLQAATASQVSEFLVELFQVAEPGMAPSTELSARHILDNGYTRIERALQDQPLVRAGLLHTMGRAYRGLGLYDRAEELLTESLTLQTQVLGAHSLEAANTLQALGGLFKIMERYPDALRAYEDALDIRKQLQGDEHPSVAVLQIALGSIHARLGDTPQGRELIGQGLALLEASPDASSDDLLFALNEMGVVEFREGNFQAALGYFNREREILEREPELSRTSLWNTLNNIATCHFYLGDIAASRLVFERSLALAEDLFGADHLNTATACSNLADALAELGQGEEAKNLYRRAVTIIGKTVGPDHSDMAWPLNGLANLYHSSGDLPSAEKYYLRALSIRERALGKDNPELIETLTGYARLLTDMNRLDEAEVVKSRIGRIQGAVQ